MSVEMKITDNFLIPAASVDL